MPIGNIIKVYSFFKKPYWRERGLNGTTIDSEGPCCHTMDASHKNDTHFLILGYITGECARKAVLLTN